MQPDTDTKSNWRPEAKAVATHAVRSWSDLNVGTYASSIAFFFFLSMIPLLILACAVLPYIHADQNDIIRYITIVTPDIADELVAELVRQAYNSTSKLLSVSAVVVIWTSSQAMMALIRGLDQIYQVEKKPSFFRMAVLSVFYTLITLIIMTTLMVFMVFGREVRLFLDAYLPNTRILDLGIKNGRYAVLFVIAVLLFTLIYTFGPSGVRNYLYQLPGAAISMVAWVVFSKFFSIYVNGINIYTTFYGSLTTIAILLFWMYCCFYIVLTGGFINCQFEAYIRRLFLKILRKKKD